MSLDTSVTHENVLVNSPAVCPREMAFWEVLGDSFEALEVDNTVFVPSPQAKVNGH